MVMLISELWQTHARYKSVAFSQPPLQVVKINGSQLIATICVVTRPSLQAIFFRKKIRSDHHVCRYAVADIDRYYDCSFISLRWFCQLATLLTTIEYITSGLWSTWLLLIVTVARIFVADPLLISIKGQSQYDIEYYKLQLVRMNNLHMYLIIHSL